MLDKKVLKKSIERNIQWFEKSGIMDPADGSWGVGERVILTQDNEALEKTYTSFPAFTKHGEYSIIEHRRPDCCFETALMYLLAAEELDNKKYYKTADNILNYLYCRSGMLNKKYKDFPIGAWKWCNEQWTNNIYFDDNAWNCVIPLIIAELAPDLAKRYNMKNFSLQLGEVILDAFNQHFPEVKNDGYGWLGDLKSPHWGSLVCMAFAFLYRETKNSKYIQPILEYHDYLDANKDTFTTSEHAYIVIGASIAGEILNNTKIKSTASESADRLVVKQDNDTGNIPSEWGKETPVGEHLVDTIYTQNWAVLGLHTICATKDNATYRAPFEKAMELLFKIQDDSPQKHLNGCWRGMYDMKEEKWGGGDRFEGGGNSIYSGWTNAPISIVMLFELLGKSLIYKEK